MCESYVKSSDEEVNMEERLAIGLGAIYLIFNIGFTLSMKFDLCEENEYSYEESIKLYIIIYTIASVIGVVIFYFLN